MGSSALLALADGTVFRGQSVGIDGCVNGEVVFNTAMTGYQEILTDPSYYQQIINLTYPHIGNVGTNPEDEESSRVFASALIVRDVPLLCSSWRSRESLPDYLKRHNVIALAGIDNRKLTRILRTRGAQNGCIMAGDPSEEDAIRAARSFPGLKGMDLAKEASTPRKYEWNTGTWRCESNLDSTYESSVRKPQFNVVAYDYGIKRNILRILTDYRCYVTVVPAQTSAQEVLAMSPDGVFLSNGPGDPEPCGYAISAIRQLMEADIPLFGICLGHQLLALACGAQTEKMKFGHHGANHPVLELASGRVMISSQNHGFTVDEFSLPPTLKPTHRSLFDGSLQGIHHREKPAFGFQGHPEASPGPRDVAYLFKHFMELMGKE